MLGIDLSEHTFAGYGMPVTGLPVRLRHVPIRVGLRAFMSAPETVSAVKRLSESQKLALFVGAGISKEAGLPSWSELIDGLLRRAALASHEFRLREEQLIREGADAVEPTLDLEREAASYARWIVSTHGLIGAASVVKAWLPTDDYRHAVESTLYEPVTRRGLPLQPGPTAVQIARLWVSRGPSGLVVNTTNYDRLIERALEEVGVERGRIRSIVGAPAEFPADCFCVVHLHGIAREPGSDEYVELADDRLVLAEDEYFTPSEDPAARQRRDYCERLLTDTTSLFLGTSLTDPNLLTYLYSSAAVLDTGGTREHFALSVKQGDQPPQLEASETVISLGRSAAAVRLSKMNVTSLSADYFCQSGHFLADLRGRTELGDGFVPYHERLALWKASAIERGVLPGESFTQAQGRLRRSLHAAVLAIQSAFDAKPALRCPDEQLALHLWVHDPDDDSLVFVARSDQQFFSPVTLERQPISMPIARLVVEAVCSGAVLEASGDDLRSSRWRSMLVVPIVASSKSDLPNSGPIPLGAVVLASDQQNPTGLGRLRSSPSERAYLVSALATAGGVWLVGAEEEAAIA